MITVLPRAASTAMLTNSMEEHLLERISALEYALVKMQERFERLLDILHKQASNSFTDRALLESLIDLLDQKRLVDKEVLQLLWQRQLNSRAEVSNVRELLEMRREKILLAAAEPEAAFVKMLNRAFGHFLAGEHKRAARILEKAALLDPENVELNLFLGEYFYYHQKIALARDYLQRVVERDPQHYRAVLMLGIVYSEQGEVVSAKALLQRALSLKQDSFAAHYGLGRILASEGCIDEALTHLRRALVLRPSAEMHFLVGYAYFLKDNTELALQHLQQAVEMDPGFDLALYYLGLVYLKCNLIEKARKYFQAAYDIKPITPYRTALRSRPDKLPNLLVTCKSMHQKLAKDDARWSSLLRKDLLQHAD
ncbi:MAG: tetratricopeptide repeat protein [Acidobacteriota bacterium]|nr:tetratricopeptide repeat protein [Blastocatellia bacterium]MDW8411690.1 tetratricopeptide repeat protein [Acidobacteriota bacterium]